MAKKKKKIPKQRNLVVVHMLQRSWGAGKHTDQKKEASRKACRKPVNQDD